MNKFKNKRIFIVTCLIIILVIVIYSNKDNISNLIGINVKKVTEDNSYYYLSTTCKKKINNSYILAAYKYNDSVSSGTAGYCVEGTENTCEYNECYFDSHVGQCVAGTIIKYQVNDDEVHYFNVLHDDGDTMTLQSIDVIATCIRGGTEAPTTVLTAITNATNAWSNVNDLTYTLGETIFLKYPNDSNNANPYTGCSEYNSCTTNTYTYSSNLTTNVKARIISIKEAVDLGCTNVNNSCPKYLQEYSDFLENHLYITYNHNIGKTASGVHDMKRRAVIEINK